MSPHREHCVIYLVILRVYWQFHHWFLWWCHPHADDLRRTFLQTRSDFSRVYLACRLNHLARFAWFPSRPSHSTWPWYPNAPHRSTRCQSFSEASQMMCPDTCTRATRYPAKASLLQEDNRSVIDLRHTLVLRWSDVHPWSSSEERNGKGLWSRRASKDALSLECVDVVRGHLTLEQPDWSCRQFPDLWVMKLIAKDYPSKPGASCQAVEWSEEEDRDTKTSVQRWERTLSFFLQLFYIGQREDSGWWEDIGQSVL